MLKIVFGLPGSGKTTYMCNIIKKELKNGIYKDIYCNVPTNFEEVKLFNVQWLGQYSITDSLILIDEGTLVFDNRDYKNFSKNLTTFFMLYRHFKCDVIIFCQKWDAIDLKIRTVCDVVEMIQSKPFGFTFVYDVPYRVSFVAEETNKACGNIVMGYGAPKFRKMFRRKKYYKYFDSYIKPNLPPVTEQMLNEYKYKDLLRVNK